MSGAEHTVHWEEPIPAQEALAAEARAIIEAERHERAMVIEAERKARDEIYHNVVIEAARKREATRIRVDAERAAFDAIKTGDIRPSREVVELYAAWLFEHGEKPPEADTHHFGRREVKALMDFVYGVPDGL